MIKWILFGIYIYGYVLAGVEMYKYWGIYRRFLEPGRFIREFLPHIIGTILWPLFWMHNFITYYMEPKEK